MTDKSLVSALEAWQSCHVPSESDIHCSDEQLWRLTQRGGGAAMAEAEAEHLSTCPECLARWAEWAEVAAIMDSDEAEERGETCAGIGFLKAASASLYREPVSLESSCGRFELTVYPDLEIAGKGLLTVEVVDHPERFEGRCCVVRDTTGDIIVSGVFEDGRVAGRSEDLSRIHLKTWTIVVT